MSSERSPLPWSLLEGDLRTFLAVAAAGWLIVLAAALVAAFALAPSVATFLSESRPVRETAPAASPLVQANVSIQSLQTWLPQLGFFGLGLGLAAMAMALGAIARRLQRQGRLIADQFPRRLRPPPQPLPRSVRIYESLAVVGILILFGALIYGAVLAATVVPLVWGRPIAEINAAQPGSALLTQFGFLSSFGFWLDPLRLVGLAFLFTAITIALTVIVGRLRDQAATLSGFCRQDGQ